MRHTFIFLPTSNNKILCIYHTNSPHQLSWYIYSPLTVYGLDWCIDDGSLNYITLIGMVGLRYVIVNVIKKYVILFSRSFGNKENFNGTMKMKVQCNKINY